MNKKYRMEVTKMKTDSAGVSGLWKFALAAIIIAGVILFIVLLGRSTNKETEVVLSDTSIEVKGMFGCLYDYDEISAVEMKDTMPPIGRKNNGSGLGEVHKGRFEVDGLGECRLYILSTQGPFLFIKTNDSYVIINYKEKEDTEKLYQDLLAKWEK